MTEDEKKVVKQSGKVLVDIVVESWRFTRVFARLLEKLDAGEAVKYVNQYRYYIKRLQDLLESEGMRMVNLEGQIYDIGMAAMAINIDDFAPDDILLVEQMVEPIIMGPEGVLRAGTIMLRKAN